MFKLIHADCMDALDKMEDNSIGSCITDPPYLINFMGKKWDTENSPAGDDQFWEKVLTKLKPGAYCVAFGHSRQHHRVMVAMEDAGFEIRDCMMWLYAQGFPKSHNVGKAVDKLLGKKREVVGKGQHTNIHSFTNPDAYTGTDTKPDITKGNSEWEGYGTALKPAYEPIIIARKPLEKKLTVAKNVLKHGVGAINIDGCRVSAPGEDFSNVKPRQIQKLHSLNHDENSVTYKEAKEKLQNIGRFPANVMLSHHPDCVEVGTREDAYVINKLEEWSGFGEKECPDYQSTKMRTVTKVYECDDDCPTKILDEQAPKTGQIHGTTGKEPSASKPNAIYNDYSMVEGKASTPKDKLGGASRFFYHAKVSKRERNLGCDGLETKTSQLNAGGLGRKTSVEKRKENTGTNAPVAKNIHPTVKPIALMRYLIKMYCPPKETVLDPFTGSGSTGMAAMYEGRDFIGIEREEEYLEIAEARIEYAEEDMSRRTKP